MASKKKVAKKTGGGGGGAKRKASRNALMFFMGQLIQAGHLKAIPKEPREQHQEAQRLRQMAQRLEAQVHRSGEGEEFGGGDAGGEDGEE